MKRFLVVAILPALLATGAWAQTPPPAPAAPKSAVAASCEGCGVVRSVKRVEKSQPITAQERQSTAGLVASVPLGSGKASVGSATDVRAEKKPPTVTYEVVVRLDDGRFQLVTQDDAGSLREGDKVRLDRGKVILREK